MIKPSDIALILPGRAEQLRLIAHVRRTVLVILPLGAGMGLLAAFALKILGMFEPWVDGLGGQMRLEVMLPATGLFLTTALLHSTGVGQASLANDVSLAKSDPYTAFPFFKSMVKAAGCALSMGFGCSVGPEGASRWFGAAVGVQTHRLLTFMSRLWAPVKLFNVPSSVIARAGAAAALASVFRAPLSGALMAVEDNGRVDAISLIPCLLSAASGYMAFASASGLQPLLPMPKLPPLGVQEIAWALLLGLLCGLGARGFRLLRENLDRRLGHIPLLWRGLAAGLGLALLSLPACFFFPGLAVTQGSGLEYLIHILNMDAPAPGGWLLAFFALKMFATALTLAGGGLGGIWLPCLAMGASLGAALAGIFGVANPGYLMLVGAASFAGSAHHSLLVPVVFLAETTAQASLVVPALVGAAVAFLVSSE
ncbi:MAG: chloride channel protein [Holophagales bacterium]|jgi:CIC family chloride channel protein|nr:chloride channel protein [Holophagales bacterium]